MPSLLDAGGALVVVLSLVVAGVAPGGMVGTAEASHDGSTIVVDSGGGGDVTTIQAAVDHAAAGDRIVVRGGRYAESVVVDKPVSIVTDEAVVMDGRRVDGPAFTVTNPSDNATLEGVTIRGFPAVENYSVGVAVTQTGDVASVVVRDVAIVDTTIRNATAAGVRVRTAAGRFENVTLRAVEVADSGGVGVAVTAADRGDVAGLGLHEVTVNRSGTGVAIVARGHGSVSHATVENGTLVANGVGLALGAHDRATVADVSVSRAIVRSNGAGVRVDGGPDGTFDGVRVRRSLLADNDAGVRATADSLLDGVGVHDSMLVGNAVGVDNRNGDATFDARFNWWNDSTGPGSVADAHAPFEDPATGTLADGDGDAVSEGATAGVSNVRFDPAIGGKTGCDDGQLHDPIALATDASVGTTRLGEEISGPIADFVGVCVWERAALPFRARPRHAETKVQNTRIELRTADGDIRIAGAGSNRKYLTVYDDGKPLALDFEKVSPGADTTRFAGDDVQLVVARLDGSVSPATDVRELVDASLDLETGRATVGGALTAVDAVDLGSLDGTGERRNIRYRPPGSGAYLFLLARTGSGDGFDVTDSGRLSFDVVNDSATLIGAEVAVVHETDSTVRPGTDEAREGDTVRFAVDANLGPGNYTHAVVLYDEAAFETALTVVDVTNTTAVLDGDVLATTVTGTVDGAPFLVSANLTAAGTVEDVSASGSLGDTRTAIGIVRDGANRETVEVTVPTDVAYDGARTKTFNWVHLAVNTSDAARWSTSAARRNQRIEVVRPGASIPDIDVAPRALDFGTVAVGGTGDRTVAVENNGAAPLRISSTAIVGDGGGAYQVTAGGGPDVVPPGNRTTIEIEFEPAAPGERTATLRIRSDDPTSPTVSVDLTGEGVAAADDAGGDGADGGGGGGDGTDGEDRGAGDGGSGSRSGGTPSAGTGDATAEPDDSPVVVVRRRNGSTIANVSRVDPGDRFDVPLPAGDGGDGVELGTLTLTTADTLAADAFSLVITDRSDPPAGVPPLELVGTVPQYPVVTPVGIPADAIDTIDVAYSIPAGRLEPGEHTANVGLARYDGAWRSLSTRFVGEADGRYRFVATATGPSAFAIGNADPRFAIANATIAPPAVAPAQSTTVTVIVENTGDGAGVHSLELQADGALVASRDVAVRANASRAVTFRVGFGVPGAYPLSVNDVPIGSLEVAAPTPTATPTVPPTAAPSTAAAPGPTAAPSRLPPIVEALPTPESSPIPRSWGLLLALLIAVLTLLVIYYLRV